MEIIKESVGAFLHGHKTAGLVRSQLSIAAYGDIVKGILLRAPGSGDPVANTHPVWVGGKNVTADSAEGTGGMPLCPGESLFVPLDNITAIWVVSTAEGQDLAWMVI